MRVLRIRIGGFPQRRDGVVVSFHGPIGQPLQVQHVRRVLFGLVQLLQGVQGAFATGLRTAEARSQRDGQAISNSK